MFIYHYLFTLALKSPDGEWPITYTFTFTYTFTSRARTLLRNYTTKLKNNFHTCTASICVIYQPSHVLALLVRFGQFIRRLGGEQTATLA